MERGKAVGKTPLEWLDSRRYCNEKAAEMCLVPVKLGNTGERMGHHGLLKQVKYELHLGQKTGGPPNQAFPFQV